MRLLNNCERGNIDFILLRLPLRHIEPEVMNRPFFTPTWPDGNEMQPRFMKYWFMYGDLSAEIPS